VGGELCRQHAEEISRELGRQAIGVDRQDVADAIGHALNGRFDPITGLVGDGLKRWFSDRVMGPQPPPSQRSSRPRPQQPHRAPPGARQPPRQSRPDPTIRAREILGFEPGEKLTTDVVKDRKQRLSRVFHPDMPGGSLERMKKINDAADVLLAKLAKPS